MKKKGVALLCITLLLIIVFVGCSKEGTTSSTTGLKKSEETKQSSEVRLMWWGGETRHKATVEAVEIYKGINPDVTVKTEYSGWDGYFDKLTTQLAAETGPDIVQMSYTNVAEYVAKEQLMPLDDLIK